jgi:5-methylcytosine-specific restriction endonuclease McrA
VYCGAAQEDGVTLTLDHVLACNLGGDNSPSNLVSACGSCNSSKQALTMADWYLVLRDQGVDTTVLGARIRALTSTDIAAYRTVAKKILADRVAQHGA